MPTKQGQGIEVAQWLSWADEDYLAARGLLLRDFVLQGTILANTAIEKYLKAALVARKVKFGNTHDVVGLYEALRSSGSVAPPNQTFLKTLCKAYKLRYSDRLPAGFNISLAQAKVLAEIDSTAHVLRKGFVFVRTDGREFKTKLDIQLEQGQAALLDRNAAFRSSQ